ncbi:4-coumarate--coa ligase [Plakobranchus ocellatus]|uniref:4-coumarate--coa ligase n=1 Tax=Plakobranchus ocellatus TaxID=259542 RepID=A0AAV4BSE6_9GAST|nr:4-coumarate--coa ligase [Plakobranchus ocellatus]
MSHIEAKLHSLPHRGESPPLTPIGKTLPSALKKLYPLTHTGQTPPTDPHRENSTLCLKKKQTDVLTEKVVGGSRIRQIDDKFPHLSRLNFLRNEIRPNTFA